MQARNEHYIDKAHCPVAKALDELGDRWVLLILRESFNGVKRFEDFQKNLEISRSVLTQKLQLMTERVFLEKKPYQEGNSRTRFAYHLTAKGKGLHKVLASLMEWGDTFLIHPEEESNRLVHRETGKPIYVAYRDEDFKIVHPKWVTLRKRD